MEKNKNKIFFICIFIATFFSSMLGAQLFGISLNKIALIPIYVYLLLNVRHIRLKRNCIPILIFYIFAILSSLFALTAPYASNYSTYKKECIFNFIQVMFIYIPLVFLMSNYKEKNEMKDYFIKSIIICGRLNAIWAICQFIFFIFFKIDINAMFLGIFYDADYSSSLINLSNVVYVRPTGLAADPAFFGIIIVFSFIFDRKKIFKIFYFLIVCLAMSRSSIVAISVVVVFSLLLNYKKIRINKKTISLFVSGLIFIMVLINIPTINNQMRAVIERFSNVKSSNKLDGTSRHLYYFKAALEILFTKYSFLQFFIGYGPRQSGTIIVNYHVMDNLLTDGMFLQTWATESDFSELLLGYGFIGAILYITVFLNLFKENNDMKIFAVVVLVFGLMYNISASTLLNLSIIVFTGCQKKSNKWSYSIENIEEVEVIQIEGDSISRR